MIGLFNDDCQLYRLYSLWSRNVDDELERMQMDVVVVCVVILLNWTRCQNVQLVVHL